MPPSMSCHQSDRPDGRYGERNGGRGTMTAGMTTQKLEKSQVSLPRIGLGALLAATLLVGGLIGAAASAGIGAATAQPATGHYDAVARLRAGCARQFPLQPADQQRLLAHPAAGSILPSLAGRRVVRIDSPTSAHHDHRRGRPLVCRVSAMSYPQSARVQTPSSAGIRPLLIAASRAAWSSSFWSA